jgi:FtsP/CotA-like multicopper oxidase with cupredoxin domain
LVNSAFEDDFVAMMSFTRAAAGALLVLAVCGHGGAAWADADEYTGQAWNPTSTAAHPCGVGIPQRGNFPRDRWVNGRKPTVKLTVRQDGAQLCYVIDGIAEAPVIRVQQGQTLTVTVRNEITDPAALEKLLPVAGNRERPLAALAHHSGIMDVVPGERHEITGRTNLHMHGFAVPPVAPQDEVLMGCADPAVGPAACGQRDITYHYQIPPDMPPGLYWYHPHMHGEVQAQMLAGLTGAIVVEGPDDQARNDAGIPDRVFIVRQLQDTDGKTGVAAKASGAAPAPDPATVSGLANAPGSLPAPAVSTPAPGSTLPAPPSTAARGVSVTPTPQRPTTLTATGIRIDTHHELGCTNSSMVDELSLNGAPVVDGPAQDKDLAPLSMSVGTTQLWRFVNAATDAFLDLALTDEAGKPVPIQVLARDGSPLSDDSGRPTDTSMTTDAQLVPPAGRIEFLVAAPALGQKLYLVSHAVDTGCTGDSVPERRLGVLTALPYTADAAQQAQVPSPTTAPNMFTGLLTRKTDHKRVIAFAEYPRPGDEDQTDFYIAERRPGVALVPYQMNGSPTITVPADSVEEWTVENWTNEVHAFHIHQVHFRVLSVNGQPAPDTPLLDTVTVPAAAPADVTGATQVAPGQVRIKLFFPESLAGDIPFHCHLVDHEDNGMMGVLRVISRTMRDTASHSQQ